MTQVKNGDAFEYACTIAAQAVICEYQSAYVVETERIQKCRLAYTELPSIAQTDLFNAAKSGIEHIVQYEPNLTTHNNNGVEIHLGSSQMGEQGDVRDVIIRIDERDWEIGISAKNNHDAVKHNRLSGTIDFGKKWFNIPTPQAYFDELRDTWAFLQHQETQRVLWDDIDKPRVYEHVLSTFSQTLNDMYANHHEIAYKIMEYLLGTKDYYKLIVRHQKRQTELRAFNIHGMLHMKSATGVTSKNATKLPMPSRIVEINYDAQKKYDTVYVSLDSGWQISMRIHSARSIVEPSLKFDVRLVGVPNAMLSILSDW